MQRLRLGLVRALCILALLAPWSASAQDATFSDGELDQMLAPIALHPDALLSQMLMASTYPLDVGEAVEWSAKNPDQDGDTAAAAVESESWDPSVKSLVAFPQVLAMMGEKPEWVQDVGDAFLAEPDRVMDQIQFLRDKAAQEGNLNSTEQQTVSYVDAEPQAETQAEAQPETSRTVIVEQAPAQTIVIEQANPQVVYVPSYDPTIVYGAWWWPAYRPWYWRPVGWGFGGAVVRGIGFGIGIGITNSLWGGFNWGRKSVDINVNRYNNINVNNRISSNDRNVGWKHNADGRRGAPYRDAKTRDQFSQRREGGDRRDDFRGRDAQRDASRERAQKTLADRGADPAQGRDKLRNDPQTRERANQAAKRDGVSSGDRQARAGNRADNRPSAQQADRSQARADRQNSERTRARESSTNRNRDSALRGAGSSNNTRRDANRGRSSRQSARGGGGRRR